MLFRGKRAKSKGVEAGKPGKNGNNSNGRGASGRDAGNRQSYSASPGAAD
jgi:hypothetical protein